MVRQEYLALLASTPEIPSPSNGVTIPMAPLLVLLIRATKALVRCT